MTVTSPQCAPCARCGAPMREHNAHAQTAMQVLLVCPYCGSQDVVPAEHNQKLIALRMLGMQRRWAEDAIRGPGLMMLRWLEGNVLTTYLVSYGLLLFVGVATLAGNYPVVAAMAEAAKKSRDTTFAQAVAFQVAAVGGIVGVSLATVGALLLLRGMLRRELMPLAAATPPSVPGRPASCRRCGADFVFAGGGVVKCPACQAENFIPTTHAQLHIIQMAHSVGAAQRMAMATKDRMARINGRVQLLMTLAFLAGGAVGGGLTFAITFVVLTH